MAEGRTDLSDYTVVVATREQLVQHAKIAFVHWHHNKPFQVSRRALVHTFPSKSRNDTAVC